LSKVVTQHHGHDSLTACVALHIADRLLLRFALLRIISSTATWYA